MRNLFLSMAAVAMLASCSSEEVLDKAQEQKTPISFKTPFVDNMTRANLITTSAASKVWGWAENVEIYTGISLDENGQYEDKSKIYYWDTEKAYEFVALAPQTITGTTTATYDGNKKGNIVVTGFENDGKTDLMFAAASVASFSSIADAPADVDLTFNHMLSKIKFTFTNSVSNGDVAVTNIVVSEAPKTGKFTAEYSSASSAYIYSWDNSGTDFSFSEISNLSSVSKTGTASDEILLLPGTISFKVSFETTLTANISFPAKSHEITINITGGLKVGHSYNFTADLTDANVADGAKPIVFTVQDGQGWTPVADQSVTVQ